MALPELRVTPPSSPNAPPPDALTFLVAPPARQPHARLRAESEYGSRPMLVMVMTLLCIVFALDLGTAENLHVSILFVVCIALSLWTWRPGWVAVVTVFSLVMRLTAHALEPNLRLEETPLENGFNLVVGLAVQTLTGALIWRHVVVQGEWDVAREQTVQQARELAKALGEAQRAMAEAQEAARREQAARQREGEARRRERATLTALERVKNLSVALHRAVLPDVPGQVAQGRVHLAARYTPAEHEMQIGGDFYDVIPLDDAHTRWGLVIGDVAGHGVDAAAQTALVTTTLRICALEGDRPADVLTRLAKMLEGQMESFVSLFYGMYDAQTGLLTYANAGHEPPILLREAALDGPVALNPTGAILGVGLHEFTEAQVPLAAGDILVLMTDGLTEVRPAAGEMLGWDGLAAIAAWQAAQSREVEQIADGIISETRALAPSRQFVDDIALLVARIAA